MYLNQNSGYGQAQLGGIPFTTGKVFLVANSSDDMDMMSQLFKNDEDGNVRYFSSLAAAYDAVSSGRNDIIILGANNSHLLDSMLTLSKNRFSIIGLDYLLTGGKSTGQRSKVELSATGITSDSAATITVSGIGINLKGIKFTNWGTHANSIATAIFAGEADYIDSCSFTKFTDLDQTGVADVILRCDSNEFVNCEFGFDTLLQSVVRPTVRILNSGATRMVKTRLKDCYFIKATSTANNLFIRVDNSSSLAFTNEIIRPIFNAAVIGSEAAIVTDNCIAGVAGLSEGQLLVIYPATNCTKVCAGTTTGIKVVGPANDASTGVGGTPA